MKALTSRGADRSVVPAEPPEQVTEQAPALEGREAGARVEDSPDGAGPGDRPSAQSPEGAEAEHRATDVTSSSVVSEAAAALPQVLKVIGSVVAPTSLLTGLLFYFGRVHATTLCQYFGVNFTVLDLTVQDYLMRSVDALSMPLIILMGLGLVGLWLHQILLGTLPTGARRGLLRMLTPLAAISGTILVALSMADVTGAWVFSFGEGRGLSLSIGVLLLAYAARLLRLLMAERQPGDHPRQPIGAVVVAQWGIVFTIVSIGLFWAVASYAGGVGQQRAQQIAEALPYMPNAVLFSEKDLSLKGPGISVVPCGEDENAAYRYRYSGLTLLLQSGSQYFLVPKEWTPQHGHAILIPRGEGVRLEFGRHEQPLDGTC